jgi:hypothetical protein
MSLLIIRASNFLGTNLRAYLNESNVLKFMSIRYIPNQQLQIIAGYDYS